MAVGQIISRAIAQGAITSDDIGALEITHAKLHTDMDLSSKTVTMPAVVRGPATLTIDPAAVGDNTGTLVIAGNLQVDGTTTTINSTTMTVDDKNLVLASGAGNSAAADGAGITIDGASATMLYTHATTSFDFNKPVNITGTLGVTGATTLSSSLRSVGNFDVNTNKFTVNASSGNTAIAGTLGVTGATTLSGNVGIGDSTPIEGRLTVRSDTNSNAIFAGGQATTGQSYGVLVNAGTNASDANFRSYDQTGSTPYFIVRGDGNIGIGSTSPSEKFVVHGDGARMIVSSNDYEVAMLGRRGSSGAALDGGYLRLREAGVNKVILDTNGTSSITGGNLQLGDIAEQTAGANVNLTKTSDNAIVSIMSRSATDGHTGILNFYKTPATSGNYTATASGDVLGEIRFSGVNTSSVADIGAKIAVEQTGTNAGTVPAKMTFTTQETQRISIHADGHIGIGDNVTVSSAWSNVFGARVQLDTKGVIAATDGSMQIGHNWYYDGGGSTGYKYIASGKANRQIHVDDYISWEMEETAGTAGAEITFTERMRFTKDGKLGLNTASGNPSDNIVAVVGNGGGILLSTYWNGSATSGQKLGAIGFKGYANGNTNAAADAKIEAVAASNHSGSSAPAHLDFYTKDDSIGPGSGPTRRFRIDEYGGQIVHASTNNWSKVQHNQNQGSNIHYRLYGAGSSTTTYNLLRYRRHYWGHGSIHITLFQTYYSTTSQGEYWLLGHGRSDGSYSPSYSLDYRDIYNGPGSGRLSINLPGGAPGNSSAEIVDVSISIPAYVYYMVKIETAHSEFYPTTSVMGAINSYALHA